LRVAIDRSLPEQNASNNYDRSEQENDPLGGRANFCATAITIVERKVLGYAVLKRDKVIERARVLHDTTPFLENIMARAEKPARAMMFGERFVNDACA